MSSPCVNEAAVLNCGFKNKPNLNKLVSFVSLPLKASIIGLIYFTGFLGSPILSNADKNVCWNSLRFLTFPGSVAGFF